MSHSMGMTNTLRTGKIVASILMPLMPASKKQGLFVVTASIMTRKTKLGRVQRVCRGWARVCEGGQCYCPSVSGPCSKREPRACEIEDLASRDHVPLRWQFHSESELLAFSLSSTTARPEEEKR
jgi:hypothetical protein